jgi:hypothetical protein
MKKKRKIKVPRTRGGGKYTESQYFSRIRSALRKAFQFWPPMQEALKKASRPSQSSNKRLKIEYQCNSCKKWFPRNKVQIDHIIECGSLKNYADIEIFIKRLTPEDVSSFQVLCKDKCHKKKTEKYLNDKKNE